MWKEAGAPTALSFWLNTIKKGVGLVLVHPVEINSDV
jgi:hypothetical protein